MVLKLNILHIYVYVPQFQLFMSYLFNEEWNLAEETSSTSNRVYKPENV